MLIHSLLTNKLASELNTQLQNFRLENCYCQNKDEIIFEFSDNDKIFVIITDLSQNFCTCYFPNIHHRAKKNSIDLFKEIKNLNVIKVSPTPLDRSFVIEFENNFFLAFKMYGNLANIILFENENTISQFKNSIESDHKSTYSQLISKQIPTFENWQQNDFKISKTFLFLGKELAEKFENNISKFDKNETTFSILIKEIESIFSAPNYYLNKLETNPKIKLVSNSENDTLYISAIDVLNDWQKIYYRNFHLSDAKTDLKKNMTLKLNATTKNLEELHRKQDEAILKANYKIFGDIIMANMHELKLGLKSAQLFNFYDNQLVEIKLKESLSPQANAAWYYEKSKKQHLEFENIEVTIEKKTFWKNQLTAWLQELEISEDLKKINLISKQYDQLLNLQDNTLEKKLPYREFFHMGWQIWVGKNAKCNDELIIKYAHKEDHWLHSKDVPGSHVIIKRNAGQNLPKPVAEFAASLAAHYSARKNDSVVPVSITLRKYITKTKNMPSGMVRVDREEVILTKPWEKIE